MAAGEMWSGLRTGAYAGYRLYKQSRLHEQRSTRWSGIWDFAEPLVIAAVFIILRAGSVVDVGETEMSYGLFVVVGMLQWQTFVDALTRPLGLIRSSRNLLLHTKVSPESLLLMVVYEVGYKAALRVITTIGIVFLWGEGDLLGALLFAATFSLNLIVGLGLGLMLSPLSTIYGDVERVVGIIIRPMMFMSGVVFPLTGDLQFLVFYNPVAFLIDNLRTILATGIPSYPGGLLIMLAASLLILLLSWAIFHRTVRVLVERV